MVMAVKLAHHSSECLLAIVGYEGGFTALHALSPSSENSAVPQLARLMYLSQPHSQPVLSLDASPDGAMYFTSSADAVIAAHRVPELILDVDDSPSQVVVDKSEGNIDEATVAETNTSTEKSPREISVDATPVLPSQVDSPNIVESFNNDSNSLTFSKQQVPSSTSTPSELSFTREATPNTKVTSSPNPPKPSGLSSLLSSTPSPVKAKPKPPSALNSVVQPPHKSIQTKHAGQQSLQVRSDGRLLVTAGWDSRVRIYSAKTLKELAVLKWHNEGVYATAFGEILDHASFTSLDPASEDGREVPQDQSVVPAKEHGAQQRVSGLTKLQQQREWQVQMKHWVVAGAKDGKVSLWEVY
jgi:WD40 repeat protein